MHNVFNNLNTVVNKSTINDFRSYLSAFPAVDKWMIFSDYCFKIKDKPYDCMGFVIVPYITSLDNIQAYIKNIAPSDLKHTRSVSDEFCEFYNSGLLFSINFQLEKNNWFNKILDVENIQLFITSHIKILKQWAISTPHNKDHYNLIAKHLTVFLHESKRKSFNVTLAKNIIMTCFFSSYLTYLLIRETHVEHIGWFSDTDDITTGFGGILGDLYEIQHHTICSTELGEEYKKPQHYYSGGQKPMFYDELNRLADYICGFVSEYDLKDTSKNYLRKYKEISTKIISDNKYISIIKLTEKKLNRVKHSTMNVYYSDLEI